MEYETFDKLIADARRTLQAATQEAESVVNTLAPVTAQYMIELGHHLMDRAIREHPRAIQEMAKPDLEKLKASFMETLAQMPRLSERSLQAIAWPHRADIPESQLVDNRALYNIATEAQQAIEEAARHLLGAIGALLIEYGLAGGQLGSEWRVSAGSKVRYSYELPDIGIAHAAQFKEIRKQYNTAVDKQITATKTLFAAEHAKAQAQAKDSWERS